MEENHIAEIYQLAEYYSPEGTLLAQDMYETAFMAQVPDADNVLLATKDFICREINGEIALLNVPRSPIPGSSSDQ